MLAAIVAKWALQICLNVALIPLFCQLPHNISVRGPVRYVFAHMFPCNSPVLVDDESRGRGNSVAKQIENIVSTSYIAVVIGQHRKLCAYQSRHLKSVRNIVSTDYRKSDPITLQCWINLLQLTELGAADDSEKTTVEHQHKHLIILEQLVQRDLLPVGVW